MSAATTALPMLTGALSTGVDGLDDILGGGYADTHIHLIEGQPGTGKTTLALQFLRDGNARGERTLYITLSETRNELLAAAASHGWSLDGIDIYEIVPPELSLDPAQEQSVIYTADLELGETVRMVMAELERVHPTRVVFDSLADIRLLAQSGLRYRRQVMALKYYLSRNGTTALLLDDLTEHRDNLALHSIAHGVIRLDQVAPQFGAERRRLRVYKMRGREFRGGFHDFVIRKGGIMLFPRLVAAEHREQRTIGPILASNVAALDALIGGGLDRGTGTLLLGPSGAGKSSLALQFVTSALAGGEKVLMISFDEVRHVLLRRAAGMGMDLTPHLQTGQLTLEQVDPAEFPPGEVVSVVRRHVEQLGTSVVVLDSLNGYQSAMLDEAFLVLQIHELLSYLNQQGVVTLLVLAQHGLVGPMQTTVDLTYVSDAVLLLRFFEAGGQIRRAISVMKKRTGGHESTIREYRIDSRGIRVGEPLTEFRGVLTGVPSYVGTSNALLILGPMQNADLRAPGPVLVLAPSGRDAAVICGLLAQVGIGSAVCESLTPLVERLEAADAGAALIAQEALLGDTSMLRQWISDQPPWSDFPFVLLTSRDLTARADAQQPTRLAAALGNVTVLERPLHPVSLVSAVGAALRARSRQRETAELLAERDRHAAALRASEARFRAIVDGMPQPIWTADANGSPDFFNARWLEVTGTTPPMRKPDADASTEPFAWDNLLHPDDFDRTVSDWRSAVRDGVAFRSEFRLHTNDGGWRWFTGRALPVHDDLSGNIVRWFGSCTDIDNAVRAREALARSTEELEQVVSERTASLQREMLEREKAEAALAQAQKMEAVGQLTGGVAHDFNNLLTAVLGSLQMIGKRSDDPQIRRFADNARRAAERGARLTQQLLAFSRRQRLAPEPVDLPQLVAEITDLLARAVGTTVMLDTRLAADLPPAFVDPTQMELVLLNLAINARDAMDGSGVLTISGFALPSVPLELAEDLAAGRFVAIAVTDTGSGMTPEVQERAFEPFFTTKEQGKGTGLGLSQVYGFVRQSGGAVKLRSAPGEGTTVTLYLPSAEAAPAVERVEAAEPIMPVRHASILVVDDDDDVRDLVVAMLEDLGYRVTAAADGRIALDLLTRNSPYDLLLADVAMPGLSGVDVVHAARERGMAFRVLFATGYADLGAYRPGLEGEDMIRKPYRMADLAARVDRALRAPLRCRNTTGGSAAERPATTASA